MPIRLRISVIIASLILFTAACSKKNKQGKYVPKDAAVVVHINGASLSEKLPWQEVKTNELFKELQADSSITAFVKQALDNPENTGIDTKTDLLFFLQKDSMGGYAAFTGTIKDAEKFKLFNLDVAKSGVESEEAGINFISKYPMCVAWNKEKFVYLFNAPELNMQKYAGGNTDVSPKDRDIRAACKIAFDLKESNSLAEDEKFTALVKKTGDIHFWMNSEMLNKDNPAFSAMAGIGDFSKFLKGSITAATVNFDNGKINMDATSYSSKELTELWKKNGKDFDETILKRMPAENVAAVFAMGFKPEGIKEFLKLLGVEGYANMGLAFAGFTLDDFIKANKGDVAIAVTNFKAASDTALIENNNADLFKSAPDFIFTTSVGDKDAFNKLVKAGEKFGKGEITGMPAISYNTNGNYFAIGNSKENVDKFIGGNNASNPDYLSKINGQSFGGYVNLQYILKSFAKEATKDTTAKVIYDASLKFWDNVYMKGGDFKDGGITQTVEINLMDKTTNSAKQLNSYIGIISKEGKKKSDEQKREADKWEYMDLDSLKTTLPTTLPSNK